MSRAPRALSLLLWRPPPAIDRSPSLEHPKSNPFATSLPVHRRTHFSPFPLHSHFQSSLTGALSLSLSGSCHCARRSGLLSHSRVQPPHSLGVQHPGTPYAARGEAVPPLEHRRPFLPLLSLLSSLCVTGGRRRREGERKRKEERKEKKGKEKVLTGGSINSDFLHFLYLI